MALYHDDIVAFRFEPRDNNRWWISPVFVSGKSPPIALVSGDYNDTRAIGQRSFEECVGKIIHLKSAYDL
jgi:hypothetical protein